MLHVYDQVIMKKITAGTIITLIAAVFVVIVLISQHKAQDKKDANIIRIGVAVPLTGNYASVGEKIKCGMDLAKKDIETKTPGLTVELRYEDACMAKEMVPTVQKLISVYDIKIINQFCAVGIVPSIPVTEAARVINVSIAANSSDLLGKKYFFSPNFAVRVNARTIADFGSNTLKAKKAAFLYYDTPFGRDYRKNTGDRFVANGGTIVADEMVSLEIKDFTTSLVKIRESRPDVIFVTHITGGLATILKQKTVLGITTPFVGNYQNEDAGVLATAGRAAEGFIVSSADPNILSKDTSGFRERFEKEYGMLPEAFASNAYDALRLEVAAWIPCKGDTDCMIKELHKVTDYAGVSGTITIDEDGVASKPTVFKIVKDGKFEVYNLP